MQAVASFYLLKLDGGINRFVNDKRNPLTAVINGKYSKRFS